MDTQVIGYVLGIIFALPLISASITLAIAIPYILAKLLKEEFK